MNPVAVPGADYVSHVRRAALVGGVLSLKVHWNQVEWFRGSGIGGDVFDIFPNRLADLRVVYLRRMDLVAQAVSSLIAVATNVFYQVRGERAEPSFELRDLPCEPPSYDFYALLERVFVLANDEQSWRQFFDGEGIVPFEVYYEDLASEFEQTVQGVVNFLGLRSTATAYSDYVKQATELNDFYANRFREDLRRNGLVDSITPAFAARLGLEGPEKVGRYH